MSDQKGWMKKDEHMIGHETSLETPADVMRGFLTPVEDFFVCNSTKSVVGIDVESYRVEIGGDGVERPLSLTLAEIRQLPSHTVFSYLECAGNLRSLYEDVLGEKIEPGWTMWQFGGVGMAEWTGVSLRDVLALAGVKDTAVDVNIQGLDEDAPEGGVNRPMPIAKALDVDTILAYRMNGGVLPADHGYPLRAIVPGWVGTNSVKWVGKITVSTSKVWVERNTTMYVLKGEVWPEESHGPAEGGAITTQNIKSSLSLRWGARLAAGRQLLRGYARSPHSPIAKVEWRVNDGAWQEARLSGPRMRYGWRPFEFAWEATLGEHTIMTRATDEAGNTQPLRHPFNQEGYMFNMVYPHPVVVQ